MSVMLFFVAALAAHDLDPREQEGAVRVFGAGEATEWAVLRPSIRRSGDTAQAIVRVSHFRQARLRGEDELELTVDCRSNRYRPVALVRREQGLLVERRAVSETEFPLTLAQPGTGPDAAVQRICDTRFESGNSVSTSLAASPD